jgi:hypothetical protein
MPMWLLHVPLQIDEIAVSRCYDHDAYHQMLKGSSKRVMSMPLSSLRALSPSACLPADHERNNKQEINCAYLCKHLNSGVYLGRNLADNTC